MNENLNSPNEEEVDIDTTENVEPVEDETTTETEESVEDKLAKLEETNKKLFARAKKAETELKASKESSDAEPVQKAEPIEDISDVIDKKVAEKLDEKELDAVNISDAAKKSIKAYAKAEGLTIKQAMSSDYFTFVKDKEEAAKKVEEATIGKGKGAPTKQNFDVNNPPKLDLTTEEGQKTWEDYKAWIKTQG